MSSKLEDVIQGLIDLLDRVMNNQLQFTKNMEESFREITGKVMELEGRIKEIENNNKGGVK